MHYSTSFQINFHIDLRCFTLLRCFLDFRCLNLGASISCKLFSARTRSAGGHIAQFFSKAFYTFISKIAFLFFTHFNRLQRIPKFRFSFAKINTTLIRKQLIKCIFVSERWKRLAARLLLLRRNNNSQASFFFVFFFGFCFVVFCSLLGQPTKSSQKIGSCFWTQQQEAAAAAAQHRRWRCCSRSRRRRRSGRQAAAVKHRRELYCSAVW